MPALKIETRAQFKERLMREGTWAAFLAHRVALRREGKPEDEVREILAPKYGGIQRGANDKTGEIVDVPDKPVFEAVIDGKVLKPATEQAPEEPLITLAMFEGKACDERECVKFVFEYMDVSDVTPSMAPSAGAWGLLLTCRRSQIFKTEFYKSIWPKLLPTKSQLDLQNQFADDGRDASELIAKMQRQIAETPTCGLNTTN